MVLGLASPSILYLPQRLPRHTVHGRSDSHGTAGGNRKPTESCLLLQIHAEVPSLSNSKRCRPNPCWVSPGSKNSLIVWFMKESQFEQLVLQYVGRPKYKPIKARILAKNLEIPKDQQDAFRSFVKRMVRDGKLSYGENHKLQKGNGSADARSSEVTGKFQRKAGGFGFVRPKTPSPARATATSTFPRVKPKMRRPVTGFASRFAWRDAKETSSSVAKSWKSSSVARINLSARTSKKMAEHSSESLARPSNRLFTLVTPAQERRAGRQGRD